MKSTAMFKNINCLKISSIGFGILVVGLNNADAQVRYAALLPDTELRVTQKPSSSKKDMVISPTENYLFKFNLNALPIKAHVDTVRLRLYVNTEANKDKQTYSIQPVTILQDKAATWTETTASWDAPVFGPASIGLTQIKANTTMADIELNLTPASRNVPTGILSLRARSPKPGESTTFWSGLSAKPADFSMQPKLIVRYSVGIMPHRSDWTQMANGPMHTNATQWKANEYVSKATVREMPVAGYITGSNPTGQVSLYKGKPIICTQEQTGTNTYFVKQLDAAGKELWKVPVDAASKYWPAIDENGAMFYFTENKLVLLNLNANGEKQECLYTKLLKDGGLDLAGKSSPITIVNTPTLGYSGVLYLPTDLGLIALTPMPQRQASAAFPVYKILWKYDYKYSEARIGPVSLSPDERKAFFIEVDIKKENGKLMALNAFDGTDLTHSENILAPYSNDGRTNRYIPAPVVVDNTKVFVLNGYDNSHELFLFKTESAKITVEEKVVAPEGGPISQPVVCQNFKTYLVCDNRLAQYNYTAAIGKRVKVFKNSGELDNASILVADNSSHVSVFALSPQNNYVAGYRQENDTTMIKAFDPVSLGGANAGTTQADYYRKNLVLSSDGILYTANYTKLVAIVPVEIGAGTGGVNTVKEVMPNTLYRASNSIMMAPSSVVKEGVNAIIYSGGTISLPANFGVQQGADLIFKTKF